MFKFTLSSKRNDEVNVISHQPDQMGTGTFTVWIKEEYLSSIKPARHIIPSQHFPGSLDFHNALQGIGREFEDSGEICLLPIRERLKESGRPSRLPGL